jgi:hypothetical protein
MSYNSKFRLSFTAQQIHYLHALVKSDQSIATQDMKTDLNRYFTVMITKLEVGAVSTAFVSSPKVSVEDKLGFGQTPEEKRHAAYLKYQGNHMLCTDEEIRLAKTHMYENGMMTAAEEAAFEEGE